MQKGNLKHAPALLLTAVVIFSSFTSYSGKKAVVKTASSPAESKVVSSNMGIIKKTTIEGVNGSFYDANLKESPRNLKGKTFTLMTLWTDNYKDWKHATKDAQRCAQAIKTIDSDYNCNLVVKTYPTGNDKVITEARAAGRVPANIFETYGSGLSVFSSGNGADLTTVNTVDVKNNPWDPVETLVSSYKSKVFGVNVRYDTKEQDLLFFNKKLASTYNLGNFYNMVNDDKWTDNRFLQVCQTFKKCCGSKYIVSSAMAPSHLLNLVYANWTSPFGIISNKYIFNGTDSSVLSILSYLQNFVKQGLFDTFTDKSDWQANGIWTASGMDYTHALSEFISGKSLFFFGSNANTMLPSISSCAKDDYGLLPLPKGPSADDYTTVITNCRYFSLFSGDPDLEDSGALLTALANRTNIKTADIVANNATLTRDKESVDTLTQNYLHKQIIDIELNNSGNLPGIYYNAALTCVLKGQSTPKQAMDSISKTAQAAINTAYGQE